MTPVTQIHWKQMVRFYMRLGIYVSSIIRHKAMITLEFIVYMDVMCDKSRKLGEGSNSYSVVAYVTKLS